MTKPAVKMDPPPQARKIVEQHTRAIDLAQEEAVRKITSAASVLTGR